jgi:tRNA(Ile)-lysidine synthase
MNPATSSDQPLVEQLRHSLLLQPPGPLAVGFSGGLDSSVLLHALAALPEARARGLRALHVDHRLQPASADWARHCAGFCAGLGIAFECRAVTVEPAGHGLEAAARDARYQAFEHWLQPGETLLLAHHRDDQIETLLLRLLRGASGAGLGMPAQRRLGRGRLWRPLLETGRDALLAYARTCQLDWIDDPSNADPRHDRNFLRHQVLPLLRQRWPRADPALAASARLLAEDAELIERMTDDVLAAAIGDDPHTLALAPLRPLSPVLVRHLLRRWLRGLGLPLPPASILQRLQTELIDAGVDRQPCLRWGEVELRRHRDRLHAGRCQPAVARDWSLDWDGSRTLPLPGSFGSLTLEPAVAALLPMRVQPRRGGERILLPGRPRRSLKHLLQELGLPPWQRARLPLLFAADDGELLAAGDHAVSARLQCLLDERGLSLRWQPAAID